jgi:GTP-binding protein HflX
LNGRPGGGERVVLVHINFPAGLMAEDIQEFQELATSAGAKIIEVVTGARRAPEPKYFVGTGKAEEIRDIVKASKVELVIFNHVLSPGQERNLEKLLQCRVLDRTGLILDIFALRARSFEGKLQVELAMLKRMSTRLVRGWTHLERQAGGIGLRGPGETQLETDRRLIRNKIKNIAGRISKISKQREQGRRARKRAVIPTVALVGYTNAGKSTLFNRLTGAEVYTADQLFATLDPTLRRVEFPDTGPVILADTVGFIRHLPHDLVVAFKATLEEVAQADLLLHVIDVGDDERDAHIEQVNEVLHQIGAEEVPRILVLNKIDLKPELQPKIDRDDLGQVKRVYLSSVKNQGIHELISAVSEKIGQEMIEKTVELTPLQAKLRAQLYDQNAVLAEQVDENGHYHLRIRMRRVELDKLFG